MSALFVAWCLKLTIWLLATTSRTVDGQTAIDPCNPPTYCVVGTIPDPENCQRYKICDNGRWVSLPCPDGTLFDNITLECKTAYEASCQPSCPPVTGTTVLPTTLPPGLCPDDNITSCYDEPNLTKKFPDRSSCFSYFLCGVNNGIPYYLPQACVQAQYFDIDQLDCIPLDDDFYTNCGYRCRTPAPTTDDVAITTSGQLTTVPLTTVHSTAASTTIITTTTTTTESVTDGTTITSRLPAHSETTPGSSSSSSSSSGGGGGTTNYPTSATTLRITILSSSSSPAATTTTLTEPPPPESFDIVPIVAGCVAGGIVAVVAVVIVVIVYRKKKRLNAITPSSSKEILPDSDNIDAEAGEHRQDRTPTPDNEPDVAVFSSDLEALIPGESVKKASTLPPIGPPQNVAGDDVTFTAGNDVPTVAAVTAAVATQNKTYAKRTKKFRRRLLEPFVNQHPTREQALKIVAAYKKKHAKLLNEQWDERQKEIDDNYNNHLKGIQFDASQAHHLFTEKMSSVEYNDHDTIGRLASEHVNELTSLWRKQQQLLTEQEAALRQRLDVEKLTSKEKSSLDVNGKKMKKLGKRHEQEVEDLNQRFMHDVLAASSDDELQRIIEQYRVEQGEMQDRHLAERLSYGDRLRRAVRKQEIEQLDTTWSETCAELDKTYSYPVAAMNPAAMHEMLNEHLNELDVAAQKQVNTGSNDVTGSASLSSTTTEVPSFEQRPGDNVGLTSAGKRPQNTTSSATSTAEVSATAAAVSAADRARRNTPWMFGGSKVTPSLQQRRLTIIEDLDDEMEENDREGTSSGADLGERAPTTDEVTKSRQPEVDLAATTTTPSSSSPFDQQQTDVRSAWQDEPPATSQRTSVGRRFSAYETPVSQQLESNNATVGGLSLPVQPTRRRISVMERGVDIEDIQRQMMEEYHTTRKRVKEINTYQREITDEKLREKLRLYQQQKKLKQQQQQQRTSRSDATASDA